MVRQLGHGCAAVPVSELGTNCWHPCRFIQEDGRCDRIWPCSYPEKKHCEAVYAEIRQIMQEQGRLILVYRNLFQRIKELAEMLE